MDGSLISTFYSPTFAWVQKLDLGKIKDGALRDRGRSEFETVP